MNKHSVKIRTYSNDKSLVQKRRRQIVINSTDLFVKKGYAKTSMREVAQACNMSIGTLYHYVGSKEDILYLIISYTADQQREIIDSFFNTLSNLKPTQALIRLIWTLYQWQHVNQNIVLFIYRETKNLSQTNRQLVFDSEKYIIALTEEVLKRGVEAGEFKINNTTLMAHNIIALSHIWVLRRWFLRKHCTWEEYVRTQTEYVLKIIRANESLT
jgi:AcrR family transcriptional regulator